MGNRRVQAMEPRSTADDHDLINVAGPFVRAHKEMSNMNLTAVAYQIHGLIASQWLAASDQNCTTGSSVCLTPDGSKLPGFDELHNLTNGIGAFALVAALASLVIGAAAWAIGSHSQNPRLAQNGKMAVMVAALGGLLIGGAANIVNFFYTNGSNIH
jgi:uncharacterized protein DUF6112